jgi:hypothetical protein
MNLLLMSGGTVQTNNRSFIESGNARSEARWRGAVDELAREGLLEDRCGQHELIFRHRRRLSSCRSPQTHLKPGTPVATGGTRDPGAGI